MFPINKFVIKKVSETATEGVFAVGPLPTGYGNTVGSVFRRILLSTIPGAAVTAVRVHGVQHEYTTVAGLQDDVLAIVLALKGLAVVSHSEEPVVLKLQAKGKKAGPVEVTAADIESNSLVEIINPEHPITTLADEKSELDLEITVSKGIGYALADDDVRQEVGAIPVDAIFTPVRSVNINVSNARVGQQTDLDQLDLIVTTNGAISPSAALYEAAEVLVKVSEHLADTAKESLSAKAEKEVAEASLPIADQEQVEAKSTKAELLVSDLSLSTRLLNALSNGGFEDLTALQGLTEEEVRNIKGMGDKSFQELLGVLHEHGIQLI